MTSKKLTAFVIAVLLFQFSYSQIYKIKADTLLVTKDSCNAELNLENGTRHVNGFLYNKGNGRTEFRKGLIKIDDNTYIIGSDTLKLNGNGGASGDFIKNQYAAKQEASAWIDSLKGINVTADTLKTKRLKIRVNVWDSTNTPIADGGGWLVAGGQHTSTYFGLNALKAGNPAYYFQNSAFGFSALGNGGSGNNDAFGGWALGNLVSGSENSAFGRDALGTLQTGSKNTGAGLVSLYDLTSGNFNTAIGNRTGRGITTGNYNTVVGASVSGLPAALERTVIIASGEGGSGAYRFYSPSSGNVLFGTTTDDLANKLQIAGNTKATGNLAVTGRTLLGGVVDNGITSLQVKGHALIDEMFVGKGSSNQFSNIYIGNTTGATSTTAGPNNTIIGYHANNASTSGGTGNTAIGSFAAANNTTGGDNTNIGYSSGLYSTIGWGNTNIGSGAGKNNTTGNYNTNIGCYAGNAGSYNSSLGYMAGIYNGGLNNVFIGYAAGQYVNAGQQLTNPTKSIYIGSDGRAAAANETNAIVIGSDGRGLGSNTTVIGNAQTQITALMGRVLVGTTVDDGLNKLQVSGSIKTDTAKIAQRIAVKDKWIDSIQQDTAFSGKLTAVPTSDAVSRYVKGYVSENIQPAATSNEWTSEDQGFKSWAFDPISILSNENLTIGTPYAVRLKLSKPTTINNICLFVSGSSTEFHAGIYQNNTLLGQTPNMAANIASGNYNIVKLLSLNSPVMANAGYIDILFWCTGSNCSLASGDMSGFASQKNGGLTGQNLRFAVISSYMVEGQLAPSTLGTKTLPSKIFWAAIN